MKYCLNSMYPGKNQSARGWSGWLGCLLVLMAALPLLSGCESSDYKHEPPPGMGSLIIDNRTWDVIHIYHDGSYVEDVKGHDYEAFDLAPGVYRVLLTQKSGERSYSRRVDVLENKRTILKVYVNEWRWEYDVHVHYD